MCFQMMANAAGSVHDTYANMKLDKLRGKSMDWYRNQTQPLKDEYFSNISKLGSAYNPAQLKSGMDTEQANRERTFNDLAPLDTNVQIGDAAQKTLATQYNQALEGAKANGSRLAKRGALDDVVFANKINQAHTDQTASNITSKAGSLARLLQIMLQKDAANRSVMFNKMQAEFLRGAGGAAQSIYGASKGGAAGGGGGMAQMFGGGGSGGGSIPAGSAGFGSSAQGFGTNMSSLGGSWSY